MGKQGMLNTQSTQLMLKVTRCMVMSPLSHQFIGVHCTAHLHIVNVYMHFCPSV